MYDALIDAGVDFLTLSDDWGSNKRMLFAPAMWRELIKPYATRVVQHAKSRGVPVNLHSDGHILHIMDDIVEMGYASMHPVQESAGMSPREARRWTPIRHPRPQLNGARGHGSRPPPSSSLTGGWITIQGSR